VYLTPCTQNIKLINKIFYNLKPLIPRRLQILLRRLLVRIRLKKISRIWPIDPAAGAPPQNWTGWPAGKKFALVLSHDVDTCRGYENCLQLMQLEKKLGFKSSFNFVPERYGDSVDGRAEIVENGFEVGVHGLRHDGKLFYSPEKFAESAVHINRYLAEWNAAGFSSPSMHHNLSWMHILNIEYDISTFDTDPFEPQPDGVGTIFPFIVRNENNKGLKLGGLEAGKPIEGKGRDSGENPTNPINPITRAASQLPGFPASRPPGFFIELPYTLPQDFTLFVLMQEKSIDIWKRKLDWIAEKGGMALLNTHPDYMSFNHADGGNETYPVKLYAEFLEYIRDRYKGQYWHALPRDVAAFLRQDRQD